MRCGQVHVHRSQLCCHYPASNALLRQRSNRVCLVRESHANRAGANGEDRIMVVRAHVELSILAVQAKAALDSSQTIAVSQQLVAFAVLVGGEGLWARQRLPEGKPGRPSLQVTGACGGIILLVWHFALPGHPSWFTRVSDDATSCVLPCLHTTMLKHDHSTS